MSRTGKARTESTGVVAGRRGGGGGLWGEGDRFGGRESFKTWVAVVGAPPRDCTRHCTRPHFEAVNSVARGDYASMFLKSCLPLN